MRVLAGGVLALSFAVGCGGGGDSREADARAYAALAQRVSSAAATYASAAAVTDDVPGCQSAHDAYHAEVRPMVDRMRAMSGGLDGHMGMMGAAGGELTCSSDAMLAELERHHAAACTSGDMGANHDEAARHAVAIDTWAEHQRACANDMGGMGGGSMATSCHRSDDGTFTLAR